MVPCGIAERGQAVFAVLGVRAAYLTRVLDLRFPVGHWSLDVPPPLGAQAAVRGGQGSGGEKKAREQF